MGVSQMAVSQSTVSKKRVSQTNVFMTRDEMLKESKDRQKGPRKMFQVSFEGKNYFVLAQNKFRANGYVLMHLGSKVQKIVPPKQEDLKAALAMMSKEELKKLLGSM
jgi:hypothetical protein